MKASKHWLHFTLFFYFSYPYAFLSLNSNFFSVFFFFFWGFFCFGLFCFCCYRTVETEEILFRPSVNEESHPKCIFCLNEQSVLGVEMYRAKEYYNFKKK